ncbi:MAG: hypothetical protein WBQ72_03215 [Terriglobales bacterium]|jgi:hypothetical protein
MPWKRLLALLLVLPFARPSFAQSADNAPTSLGDVAKKNEEARKEKDKDGSSKPKRVFTDDDFSLRKSPIPAIALQGADNVEEVLAALHEFRATHNAEDTEAVLHDWFDEQTAVLSAAIDANIQMMKHNQLRMESMQDRSAYPYNYGYDGGESSKYNERLTTERWSQRVDARSSQENFQVISRIQQALMKVRVDVICRPNKTKPAAYDWFKIRNANGTGAF